MPKLTCLLLPLVLSTAPLLGSGPPPAATVAIVGEIQGSATLRAAAVTSPEPLAPGRRLTPGAVLETAPGAAVTVTFFDGQRQVLLSGARATVRAKGLRPETGKVRQLDPVPMIVDLAPVLREGARRIRTPGVRIRGGGTASGVSGLTPSAGAPVLRAAATLSFAPALTVKVYHVVVVEDESGRVVYTQDVSVPPVRVPLELLDPGTLYRWSVESQVPPRPDLRGEAIFLTLDRKLEDAREALAREADRTDEPDLRRLLMEVDRGLGLEPQR